MIRERKQLPDNYRMRIQLNNKRGHRERELAVDGDQGNEYRVILRQSDHNPLDFSVILALKPQNSNQLFRLRRYNGKSHEHTNHIEKDKFYDFHVHEATRRYQELGGREDAYARPTNEYSDFQSAIECLIRDCGFVLPKSEHPNLFRKV